MNLIAINGSPRKDWNTAILLGKAMEGAESVGADTKLVHLYDLDYKGCTSCFACKKKGNTCNGLCARNDDLKDVLAEVIASDVLLLGSPIYFDGVTGEMRSFMERLFFPNITYDEFGKSVFPRRMSCGFVFTMNCPEEAMKDVHYDILFQMQTRPLGMFKGEVEFVTSHETWQFKDYGAMNAAMFDVEAKARIRAERFPLDCRKAFEMGARLAQA
ncbi:MAG: flavodoxin family protein [Actinobacteria bacterium]|jgi:multimeric flavodoxin WrbA|nr:flavodoxin family protein [Actinomycetota bacterium]